MFRDSIHGYIDIPKCFVDNIIDTEMFQRLRNIDQTGMRVLYPTAKHDRFAHSLGVYYLGSKAVNTILEHFSQDEYWRISSDGKAITFWANNKVLFLLACLLHDIGHTPFSHSLESIVLNNSKKGKKFFSEIVITKILELEGYSEDYKKTKAAASKAKPHELLGAMYIMDKMRDPINEIYKELKSKNYPQTNTNDFLYAEHYYQNTTVNDYISDEDLAFIARMILGLKYNDFHPEKQIRNCFIELLNGSGFDVDKLDYVIRDTKMSGISNIDIDTERLLNSIFIVTKTKYTDTTFNLMVSDEFLAEKIENKINGNSIHIQGFFRGIINIDNEATVKISKGSKIVSLVSNKDCKIKFLDNPYQATFSKGTQIIQDTIEITFEPKLSALRNNDAFNVEINNATLESDFHFVVCSNKNEGSVKLNVNGECDIEIIGKFTTESPVRFFNGNLSGYVSTAIFADNVIKDSVPKENCYNAFSIGYKKQAINVIANVMEARDYLYLWVYAHHKVIYYANFLIPTISDNVFPLAKNVWNLNYSNLELLDDSYIWTKVKELYKQRPVVIDEESFNLCKDLFNRKYRLSLYKSLAEFDLLFEEIPQDKRKKVKGFFSEHLIKNISEKTMPIDNNKAGYFSSELFTYLRKKAENKLDKITDIIYVDAAYETKRIEPNETLIATNNTIASMGEIPLLSIDYKAQQNNYYFYIYYRTDSLPKDYMDEALALKKTIKDIAIEIITNQENLESELQTGNNR